MTTKDKIIENIEIPDGVTLTIDRHTFNVKGPKGEIFKKFVHPNIKITLKEKSLNLESVRKHSKNEKRFLMTFSAHIKNMIQGVTEGFIYKLKICSGHFPMNVSIEGNNVIIKNFLGEKIPRKSKIALGVKAQVKGDEIIIESCDIALAGQTASNIEQATRVKARDRRIFMDGIWITSKPE